jgi:fumarate hydratase class II
MPTSKRSRAQFDDLISKFQTLAEAEAELLGNGDVRSSNQMAVKLMKLSAAIRTMEDGGVLVLNELIKSKNESTRSTAAYLLLPIDPDVATRELTNLCENGSNVFLANSARVTLEEWSAGRLDMDWFIKKYANKKPKRLN